MPGTYFIPRLLLAMTIPLVLSAIGPTESHPELGTDVGPLQGKKKDVEVYRAADVEAQTSLKVMEEARKKVTVLAKRRGNRIHLKKKDE